MVKSEVTTIAQNVISAFATVDADGNVTDFDVENFKSMKKMVDEAYKAIKPIADKKVADAKAVEEAIISKHAKAYYDSLNVGDTFQITNSKGETLDVEKIATKSNSGKSASCKLVNWVEKENGTPNRYPAFKFVVVPTGFVEE